VCRVDHLAHDVTGPEDAPVLVLGGSLGTTRAMWQPQLDALARTHRVLRFDHLGHGASPVPAGPYRIEQLGERVLLLLDELGLARVSYAGLSLGGMVGMWLAAHHPERVARLTLICTSAYLPPAEGWHQRAATVRERGTASLVEAVVARWFTPGFPTRHPDVVEPLVAGLRAIPDEGYAGCCEAIATMDLRPVLSRITAPTTVIAGADDPATPPEHADLLAAGIPGARRATIPGARHLPNVERADAVTALMLEHL